MNYFKYFKYFIVGYGYRDDEEGFFNLELHCGQKLDNWDMLAKIKEKLKTDYNYNNVCIINWKEFK